jgi:glycerophosphoryl diester phosphodiesterase
MHIRLSFALLVTAFACGDSGNDGQPDAASPLPSVEAYLPASAYDCSATGPFAAPPRPHAADCFSDPACDARLVAGHRMANPFAPENSLSALRAAILLGFDIVETDVRLTADGEVVFVHDGDIDRTTNGVGDIDTLTLDEIRAFDLEPETDDPPGDFACEKVPTLDEVFGLARGQIVVELEAKGSEAAAASAAYLRDNALLDQAFILCDANECAAARAEVSDVAIMSRPGDAGEVTGAIDYAPQPIMVHIDPLDSFLTDEVVAQIHGASAKVYANAFLVGDAAALASNDLSLYLQMFEDGLDVIQAEYPHYALQALGRLTPTDSP